MAPDERSSSRLDPRTFVRLCDELPEHPKIVEVGGDAGWLHVCALAYCSRHGTDGRFAAKMLTRLSDRQQPVRLAETLVTAKLWHDAEHPCDEGRCPPARSGEYVIHDYLEHQRSAEEIAAARVERSASGSRGNHARWHTERNHVEPECHWCQEERSLPHRNSDRSSDPTAIATASQQRSLTDRSAVADAIAKPSLSHRKPIAKPSLTDRKPIAELELEKEKEQDLRSKDSVSPDPDVQFEVFWKEYPKKVDKGHARKAFASALKRGVSPELLVTKAREFTQAVRGSDPKFVPHAATWLNGERHLDEPQQQPESELPEWAQW